MKETKRHRYLIRYYLIACMMLIQIIILIFFYNEYFNGRKLNELGKQIQETHKLKNILKVAKEDILNAQINLQDYIRNNKKESLQRYFISLRDLNINLDSIQYYRNGNATLDEIINSNKEKYTQLPSLKRLIDSIYAVSNKKIPKSKPFTIEGFEIHDSTRQVGIQIEQKIDSLPSKNLFTRLKDAIKNDITIKKETTIITTKYGDTLNPVVIKNMIDSIIDIVNTHYVDELKKYRAYTTNSYYKYEGIYKIYDQLISFSNKWMDVYNIATNE